MFQNVGQFQGLAKDATDAMTKSATAWTRGAQVMATEMGDYAKRSFEQGTATVQKLAGARTVDRAAEIQTEFARSSYEGFVAQATRLGEIAQTTARDVVSPLGGLAQRARSAA